MCAIACPNLPPKFLNKQKLLRCKLKLRLGMHLGLCGGGGWRSESKGVF